MIFDVKTIPDFFFAAKDDRLDGSDRHIRCVANFPVRQPAGIRENHYRSFFLGQYCEEFVEVFATGSVLIDRMMVAGS